MGIGTYTRVRTETTSTVTGIAECCWKCLAFSQNHRQMRLARTSGDHLGQPPTLKAWSPPAGSSGLRPVRLRASPRMETVQHIWQGVPVFDQPHSKKNISFA